MKDALKVGVSGVRGVVGESLTPQIATAFAQAFGAFVGRGSVVVGRDTRTTGLMIENAVVAGLQSVGCQPVLVGVVSTPTVLIVTETIGARGGIAITASHNPSQWNALKMVNRKGMFLGQSKADELLDVYHQKDYDLVAEADIPPAIVFEDAMKCHIERITNYVNCDVVRKKKFRVAIDCCNGAGALHSKSFLEDVLGCEVVPVLDDPSGRFEREPEPTPKALSLLSEAVVKHKCDIGFAQDPDADRLAIVNEKGEPIGEDLTLAFAVQQVLDHHEKGPVAINLSTSKAVEFAAKQRNVDVIRTKIGEINVSNTMLKIGSVAGGEGNGGVIIPSVHPCRDSYIGIAIILEMLAMSGKTVSEMRADIPTYYMNKGKLTIRGDKAAHILRTLRRDYEGENINLLDGVYVDFGDSWVHARRSNTEPVIRVMSEALSQEEADRLANDMREKIAIAAE